VLVVGWGSTEGSIISAAESLRADGIAIHTLHLTHLNPFPANLGEVLSRYNKIFVPELNKGQLVRLLRAEYLVDAKAISKVKGLPFTSAELIQAIREGI
jgi:2-oxoglutarate/2-oxoacid ferredoxin oxidoreductase subunit alpha